MDDQEDFEEEPIVRIERRIEDMDHLNQGAEQGAHGNGNNALANALANAQRNNIHNDNDNDNMNIDDGIEQDDDDDDDDDEEIVEDGDHNEDDNGNHDEEDEEDEDADDEDDDVEDEHEDEDENDDDVIEGGCATEDGGEKLSSSCIMYLIIECKETLPTSLVPIDHISAISDDNNNGSGNGRHDNAMQQRPHPIYQPGSKVQIGLDKTTKLSDVFSRYCEFANNYLPNMQNNDLSKSNKMKYEPLHVEPSDLEFSHCSILHKSDTAETSALMKKDKIQVRRVRKEETKTKAEWAKSQRESDRLYFKQMSILLPDKKPPQMKCDVVFHCGGKIRDEDGYKQEVLTTSVKGHSALLTKRSKWLGLKIDTAKGDFNMNNMNIDGDNGHEHVHGNDNDNDNDRQEDLLFEANQNQNHNNNGGINNINVNLNNNVVPIEDDEEDERENAVHNIHDSTDGGASDSSSVELGARAPARRNRNDANPNGNRNANAIPIAIDADNTYNERTFPHTLQVDLPHPPEAVKLLLEYCYTNRVIALGSSAFHKSCRSTNKETVDPPSVDICGPVSPYPAHRWPNNGLPTISLPVVLAGIQLAEEANIPRLSLMCEIAASQLVSSSTSLEALVLCEQQYKATGNRLTHLRRAVMLHFILGNGQTGVDALSSMSSFKRTLKEKSEDAVPSLLKGIMETVNHVLGEKDKEKYRSKGFDVDLNHRKNRSATMNLARDQGDAITRSEQRLRWRKERWNKRPRKERNPYGLPVEDKRDEYDCRKRNAIFFGGQQSQHYSVLIGSDKSRRSSKHRSGLSGKNSRSRKRR